MARVRYKPGMAGPYSGPSGLWQPGDVKDIPEAQAKHLLGPLSCWFEAVEGKAAPGENADVTATASSAVSRRIVKPAKPREK